MERKPVSSQAQRIFSVIEPLEQRFSRRPSQQEIALEAGFRSKGSANRYIKELEQAGWLTRRYLSPDAIMRS